MIELLIIDKKYQGKRINSQAFQRFKDFLAEAYSTMQTNIKPEQLAIIGEKPQKNDYIFHLPSHTGCLKAR